MNIYVTGAVRDKYDVRNYQYAPKGAGATFDFDIEKVIGSKLVPKDQNGSGSCGGQAFAYYGEVLETIATKSYEPRSARWPYSHVFAPGGGSMGKPLADFLIKNGWALEADATSYENGKPPSEKFMQTKPVLSKEAIANAEVTKAASYLQVKADIDIIAKAIEDNNGCCVALYGEDNGTWRSSYPKPPTKQTWAHWLYFGKTKMINGKKYIGCINSWGNVGKDGWQWISEDYFVNGNVWYGFTLAWDYKAPLHKQAMIQTVKLLQQVVTLYKKMLNK